MVRRTQLQKLIVKLYAAVSVNIHYVFPGAGSGLVPMYLTEIAPNKIRGSMGVLHQLALTCGILVSQLLGLRQLLGGEKTWPVLLAFSAVPFILSCIVLPCYPDSPRWLLVKKEDIHAAEKGELYQRFVNQNAHDMIHTAMCSTSSNIESSNDISIYSTSYPTHTSLV